MALHGDAGTQTPVGPDTEASVHGQSVFTAQLFTRPESSSLLLGERMGLFNSFCLPARYPANPSAKNSQSDFRLMWFLGNQNYCHRNRPQTESNVGMGAEGSMGRDQPRIQGPGCHTVHSHSVSTPSSLPAPQSAGAPSQRPHRKGWHDPLTNGSHLRAWGCSRHQTLQKICRKVPQRRQGRAGNPSTRAPGPRGGADISRNERPRKSAC